MRLIRKSGWDFPGRFKRVPQDAPYGFRFRGLGLRLRSDPGLKLSFEVRVQAETDARTDAGRRAATADLFFAISY